MKLIYDGCSRRGLLRRTNEDSYLMCAADHAALFLVADGIGGKAHGAVVSAILRDEYNAWFRRRILLPGSTVDFYTAVKEIRDILVEKNQQIIQRFGTSSAGSTLVLLFFIGNRCLYLSSGDSRIYRGRGLCVRQITVDDVYENWEDSSKDQELQKRGKLVGAVGIHSELRYTLGADILQRGDRFFLCSDGVYRYVSERLLQRKMRFGTDHPVDLISRIAEEVEDNGARDNYSMIYIQVKEV